MGPGSKSNISRRGGAATRRSLATDFADFTDRKVLIRAIREIRGEILFEGKGN
jgi:hypothetical protein